MRQSRVNLLVNPKNIDTQQTPPNRANLDYAENIMRYNSGSYMSQSDPDATDSEINF